MSAASLLSRRRGVLSEGAAASGGDAVELEDSSGLVQLEDGSGNVALEA